MTKTYKKYRSRIIFISLGFVLIWTGLSIRLVKIMVFDSSHYRKIGFKQSKIQEPLIAVRGNIYDKNDVPLTKNIIHYSVGVHVEKVKNKEEIAVSLSEITGRDSDFYSKKLKNKKTVKKLINIKI